MTDTETCHWLIEVASGNPEPSCYEDTVRIVECDGAVTFNEHGSWKCEYGHEHVSFADPARDAYDAEWAFLEGQADGRW